MKNIIKIASILFLFFSTNAYSQLSVEDTTKSHVVNDSVFVMAKSPWGAVLRSAVIPGWGQVYNESYWKVPLFAGAIVGFIYGWKYYDNRYVNYRDLYSQSLNDDLSSGNSAFLQNRDFYRDQRDLFSIYIGITYLLNLIDAYVDAQLFDFDVKENYQTLSHEFNVKFYFNR